PPAVGLVLDLTKSAQLSPAAQWGWGFAILAVGPLMGLMALGPLRARSAGLGQVAQPRGQAGLGSR
ncbi:MAG TPA: hypothetical protein VJO72_09445, partial [Candidatus Dormibacteraeota bacterium]|nr:hypothetical protein [Candidatus Dormibacteraeota bacterium]